MGLIDLCMEALRKAFIEVKEKEALLDGKDGRKNYMRQTILGCRWRAFWGVVVAVKNSGVVNIIALSIAQHREEFHEENKTKTIASVSRSLDDETVKAVTESSGWVV